MNSRDILGALESLRASHATHGSLHLGTAKLDTTRGVRQVAAAIRMACAAGMDPTPALTGLSETSLLSVLEILPDESDVEVTVSACGLTCAGLFEYDPTSRGLVLTPQARAKGHSLDTATTVAHSLTLGALGLSYNKLSRSTFQPALAEAARRFWSKETGLEELGRKAAAHGHTKESVDALLRGLFDVMGWEPELDPSIRTWLAGFAGRSAGHEVKTNSLLFLVGKGGTGKTMFFEQTALDSAPVARIQLKDAGNPQKLMESVTGHSVGCFEELNVQAKGGDRLADLKELVTATTLSARPAYGRWVERLPIPCAWGATANQPMVASDGAENRRIITAQTNGGPEDGERRYAWLHDHREALQAAAYWLYQSGYPTQLTSEAIQVNKPINEAGAVQEQTWQPYLFTKLPTLAKIITTKTDKGYNITRLTPADIAVILGTEGYPATLTAIEDTILAAGWTRPMYVSGLGPGRHPTFVPPGIDRKEVTAIPIHPDQLLEIKEALKA